ncbi:MAG: DUF58 domain-containing protein [Pirellulaceae bacterium]
MTSPRHQHHNRCLNIAERIFLAQSVEVCSKSYPLMIHVIAIAFLLLIGLMFGASMLVYSAYVLIAVYWISSFLARRWTESLRAVRTMSHSELEVGQATQIQLRLDNSGTLSIAWVLIDDALPRAVFVGPPALELTGNNLRICSVPAKSSRIVTYRLQALRRGYFQIGPTIAETGDLLGLFRRFRALTTPTFLSVLPRVIALEGYDVASSRPVGEVRVTYRLMEDPTMISGIRKYQHGDPLRSIHWRATARTGELQSKQYQPTSVAGATLVVDMHSDSNPDRHEPMRGDLAVTAAASICHTLMQVQQPFGLVSNGRDAADRFAEATAGQEFASMEEASRRVAMQQSSDRLRPVILPADRGPEHFVAIHKTLARLERTDGLRLDELLVEAESRIARDTTVLVIVQEVNETAALALGMLRRRGFSVSAIVNNFDNEAYTSAVGRLLAQHIVVYHLLDERSIPTICKDMVLRY